MAHSSYARAAGLQSEVNKITVTRVAGNEMEYKRQLNLYRKDMLLTINNIQREEKRLRKSMVKYRGRMRQHRRDRKQREKEDYERDQRAMRNMSNVLVVETPSSDIHLAPTLEKEGSPDSGLGEEVNGKLKEDDNFTDEGNVEGSESDSDIKLKSKKCVKRLRKCGSDCGSKTYIALPVINEDTEDADEISTEGTAVGEEDGQSSSGKTVEFPDIGNKSGPLAKALKPKKQVVSYADLIKLQHSTNTKKLFHLVHILAEKHGIRDEQISLKENRNIAALRSKDQGMSDSLIRAASVLYPIRFGYMSDDGPAEDEPTTPSSSQATPPSTNNSGMSSPLEARHYSKSPSPHVNSRLRNTDVAGARNSLSRQTEPNLPSVRASHPKEKMQRFHSLPTLLDQVEKIQQKAHTTKPTEKDKSHRRHSLAKATNSMPRLLPPLERKRFSEGNVYAQKYDTVSWTEAFALLKGVHNLID